MKRVIIILIALVTLQITAQERKRAFHKERQHDRVEAMKDLTPEEMATLQTKKMTLHLDLTEAQQKKIQVLNLENAKLRKAKMEEHRVMRQSSEDNGLTKEERLKMMNERLDHQIAMKRQMKDILNAEQYQKWEASQGKTGPRKDMKKNMIKRKITKEKDRQ